MVPPQQALLASLIIYPSLHLTLLSSNPTYQQIAKSREALSITHVTLQTILSASCLWHHRDALQTPEQPDTIKSTSNQPPPLIATRSVFAQTITAIEAGYLLQDSFILLHAYLRKRSSTERQLKGQNILHLGLHHAILGSLMLVLQYYIYHESEKGILVTVALHLMNASSIPGTLRWFVINFAPERTKLLASLTTIYLAIFAVVRVWVPVWIMRVHAQQKWMGFWEGVGTLPVSCRVGTATILAVNSIWLGTGVRKLLIRSGGRSREVS